MREICVKFVTHALQQSFDGGELCREVMRQKVWDVMFKVREGRCLIGGKVLGVCGIFGMVG